MGCCDTRSFPPPQLSPGSRSGVLPCGRTPGRLRTQLRRTSKTQTKKGTIYRAPTRSGSVGSLIGCRLLALHQLDVEAERLQLADAHVERFGTARLDARFALA